MVEGKCSREILACRCEINSKCPKLRKVWICWEKPTVPAWPTFTAQEPQPAAGNTPGAHRAPLSHHPARKAEPRLVGFSHIWSMTKFHFTTQVLSAQASHRYWIREFWATSAPAPSLTVPPQNSQQLLASQRFLNVPEHVSPKHPWPSYRLVLFQFGCRNCLEPLKWIKLCIHCILGLWH